MPLSRNAVARQVAVDLPPGAFVNLGIGFPELVGEWVDLECGITLHSENGILGLGPSPQGVPDYDLINAGKKPVTLRPGGSFFHHADSFGMIRGGHIDVAVMGAFEVSGRGDLANWSSGAANAVPAVGGAMDLAAGARAVFVMMDHVTRNGRPKILRACTLPLTAEAVVKRIYTDLAVISVDAEGLCVERMAAGCTCDQLVAATDASLRFAPDCEIIKEFDLPEPSK